MRKLVFSLLFFGCMMTIGVLTAWAESETHTFALPTGSVYYQSFPVKPEVPGPLVVQVNSQNQISMPEGRTLTANPLFAIIYRYDSASKRLETMKYMYFMDSVQISYSMPKEDIQNNNISYVVGVRNTNARVVADCTLKISYPGAMPKMTPKVPDNLKYAVPKNTSRPHKIKVK